jgi:uncharacterized protein YqcC (DUF446 family)
MRKWASSLAGCLHADAVESMTDTRKLTDRQKKLLDQLDRIELEMKRIGYWSGESSNLLARYQDGTLRAYTDAPSFEAWLQFVFLVNARAAVQEDKIPSQSQVGLMAMRQYDYHSSVPEAHPLMNLLGEFDALVEGRAIDWPSATTLPFDS